MCNERRQKTLGAMLNTQQSLPQALSSALQSWRSSYRATALKGLYGEKSLAPSRDKRRFTPSASQTSVQRRKQKALDSRPVSSHQPTENLILH